MIDIDLSVIIPTYNRVNTLNKCLECLALQNSSAKYEVIIIDDGSNDDTERVVSNMQRTYPVTLKYLRQPNKGPAAARNVGIKNAGGEILLFMGDDIITANHFFLQEHFNWHKTSSNTRELAVLGFTTWHPDIKITPYMYWLEHGGPQFAYNMLEHEEYADHRFFYTSNISVSKSFLGDDFFDERFAYAAYEDVELAYRLQKRGLKIIFNKNAVAYHDHKVNLRKYSQRAFFAGKSAVILEKIHPELREKKQSIKKIRRSIFFNSLMIYPRLIIAIMFERLHVLPKVFSKVYYYYYAKGKYDQLRSS